MMMKATPDKSLYAFALDPDRAGYFNLMFKSNTHSPVTTWVSVRFTIECISQETLVCQSDAGSLCLLRRKTAQRSTIM